MIGYYQHQCSCVRYVSLDNILVIALSVGLALSLSIFVIIIIVSIAYRRRQLSEDNAAASINVDNQDRSYNRRLPDNYGETGMDRGNGYNRQLPPDYVKSDVDNRQCRMIIFNTLTCSSLSLSLIHI